jgi:hypothetical protein
MRLPAMGLRPSLLDGHGHARLGERRLPGHDRHDGVGGGDEAVRQRRLLPELVLDAAVLAEEPELHLRRSDRLRRDGEVVELHAEVDIGAAELLVERRDRTDLGLGVFEVALAALQELDGLVEVALDQNRRLDLGVSTEVALGPGEHGLAELRQSGDVRLTNARHQPVGERRGAVLPTHDDLQRSRVF